MSKYLPAVTLAVVCAIIASCTFFTHQARQGDEVNAAEYIHLKEHIPLHPTLVPLYDKLFSDDGKISIRDSARLRALMDHADREAMRTK